MNRSNPRGFKWANFVSTAFIVLFAANGVRSADLGTSAAVSTISPCPSFCGGSSSTHTDFSSDGGEGIASAATTLVALEGNGSAVASFTGPTSLPVLGAFADSNPNARVSSQAVGYHAYRYLGATPTTISLDLVLEGQSSSAGGNDASGQAAYAVVLGDDIPFSTSYGTFVFEIVPGTPELTLLGNKQLFLPNNAGFQTVTGSIPMSLSPGDKFFVWASLSASGVRDGTADVLHTLRSSFSDPTNIVPVLVPEPGALSLLMLAAAAWPLRNRNTISKLRQPAAS